MSVPLALLASSLPPGSKALAALVDAHGGELTALFAKIDTMLGGDSSAKATQRKLRPLVEGGWVAIERKPGGHRTIRVLWTDSVHRTENDHPTGRIVSTGVVTNRPVALGGRGVASSNSHDLTDPPTPSSGAVSAAAQQRLEDITTEPSARGGDGPTAALTGSPAPVSEAPALGSTPSGSTDAPARQAGTTRTSATELGKGAQGQHHKDSRRAEQPQAAGAGAGASTTTQASGQLAIVPDPPKPARRPHIPRNWPVSPDELAAMTSVLAVLWEARRAAGMGIGPKPRKVTKAACGPYRGTPGLLGRYRELVADGERDPVALLGAVVRAKVQAQAKMDSREHVEGKFATGITICREDYWSTNLAAGRALMKRDNKPAKLKRIAEIDGRPLVGSEIAVWDEHAATGWAYASQRVRGHRIEQLAIGGAS